VVAEIGGRTVDAATRRMRAFLLDHPLSRQFNFVGHYGKREFGGLKLFEVVYGMFTCCVTLMCKQRLFIRVEFFIKLFDCMQIIAHTWTEYPEL